MHTKIKSYLNILSIMIYYVRKIHHAKCRFSSFPDLQSIESETIWENNFFRFLFNTNSRCCNTFSKVIVLETQAR